MSYKYPCKGCTYRHLNCHSDCEAYLEAKEKDHAEKASLKEDKIINGTLASLKIKNLRNYKKT